MSRLIDMKTRNRVDRGHCNPTGQLITGDLPEIGFREIVPQGVGVKYNLGDHTVCPLRLKQRVHLMHGPFLIVMGVAEGDESRVPVPLMRVEMGGGSGIGPGPVLLKYPFCDLYILFESFCG